MPSASTRWSFVQRGGLGCLGLVLVLGCLLAWDYHRGSAAMAAAGEQVLKEFRDLVRAGDLDGAWHRVAHYPPQWDTLEHFRGYVERHAELFQGGEPSWQERDVRSEMIVAEVRIYVRGTVVDRSGVTQMVCGAVEIEGGGNPCIHDFAVVGRE